LAPAIIRYARYFGDFDCVFRLAAEAGTYGQFLLGSRFLDRKCHDGDMPILE